MPYFGGDMGRRILAVTATAAGVLAAVLAQDPHAGAAVAARSGAAHGGLRAASSVPGDRTAGNAYDPSTTLTFAVDSGELSMSVPASAALGSGNPGTTIGPTPIGAVTVIDNRAALDASWTATAASTNFTTGGGTAPETIPASDVTYEPGTVTTTGTVTVTPSTITLSNTSQTVTSATGIIGDNTASWDPALSIAVPASAVGGTYTATLTQSVS